MSAGDRDNFSGDLELTAPTGGVTRGRAYVINDGFAVARETASAGAAYLGAVSGTVWVQKATGTGKGFGVREEVFVQSNLADKTATGAVTPLGITVRAAAAADDKVLVELVALGNE